MATWCLYVEEMTDMTTPDTSGLLCFPSDKCVKINCIRTWLVFSGSPAFTDLRMCIETEDGSKVIAESETKYQPADLFSDNFAVKEIPFGFCPELIIPPGSKLKITIKADGYTFVEDTSYIAWSYSSADPVGGCVNINNCNGKQLLVVGCDL